MRQCVFPLDRRKHSRTKRGHPVSRGSAHRSPLPGVSYFDRTGEPYGTDVSIAEGYKGTVQIQICYDGAKQNPPRKSEVTLMKRMNRFKALALIFCASLVALGLPLGAEAQTWNKRTIMKFSQTVEIPGVGQKFLPAGTYVFKLVDSLSNRDIVQISNEDETHVFATILAIPNYRLQATDETVITFRERPAGQPEAIRAWFYPGANWGQEFVYPKTRAIELAKVTQQPIPYVPPRNWRRRWPSRCRWKLLSKLLSGPLHPEVKRLS